MRRLAKTWTNHDLAADVTGVSFVFGGAVLSSLMWPNYVAALAWMPWLIRYGLRCELRIGWVLVATCQLLVGVPELVVMTWVLLGGLIIERLLAKELKIKHVPGRFAIVIGFVSVLAAVQLLPFFELLGLSQRTGDYYQEKWSLPWQGFGNFVVPLFGYFSTPQGSFAQGGQNFLTSYFPGLCVLALAGVTVWKVRTVRIRLLIGLMVLALWLALGEKAGLLMVAKSICPLLDIFRYPIKWVYMVAFILPVLAGHGVAWLMNGESDTARDRMMCLAKVGMVVAVLVMVVLMAARGTLEGGALAFLNKTAFVRLLCLAGGVFLLAWPVWKSMEVKVSGRLQMLFLAWLALAGQSAHPGRNPTLESGILQPHLARAEHDFGEDDWVGRQRFYITPRAEERLLHSWVEDHRDDMIGKRLAMWSNLNVLDQAPKVNGSSTLRMRWQDEVEKLLYPKTTETNLESYDSLKDFLGVRWETSRESIVEWNQRDSAMGVISIGQEPVAMDVPLEEALANESFSPREQVFIANDLPAGIERDSSATVEIKEARGGYYDLEVTTKKPTMLVLAESWHPGWRAHVEHDYLDVFRANHGFIAVAVPAGATSIQLVFRDLWMMEGVSVSLLGVVILLAWAMGGSWFAQFWREFRRRRG